MYADRMSARVVVELKRIYNYNYPPDNERFIKIVIIKHSHTINENGSAAAEIGQWEKSGRRLQ